MRGGVQASSWWIAQYASRAALPPERGGYPVPVTIADASAAASISICAATSARAAGVGAAASASASRHADSRQATNVWNSVKSSRDVGRFVSSTVGSKRRVGKESKLRLELANYKK